MTWPQRLKKTPLCNLIFVFTETPSHILTCKSPKCCSHGCSSRKWQYDKNEALWRLCLHFCTTRMLFLFVWFFWRNIAGSDPKCWYLMTIGYLSPESSFLAFKQLCMDQFCQNEFGLIYCYTAFRFVSLPPCQCRLFLISWMLCCDKCQPVRAALSLPWRWWAACWSPSLLVVWSPMERGRSESLCTNSSSVKRQHSSC